MNPMHDALCPCSECNPNHPMYVGKVNPVGEYVPGPRQAIAEIPNKKPTNPKDAIGSKKWFSSTVPTRVKAELGVAMLEGSLKYGRHNYRDAGVRASVYYDAAQRHLEKWWEGEDIDPDSGLSHIIKAIASLFVLRDGMLEGNYNDDRPPKINPEFWKEIQTHTERILAQFPEPVAPFIAKK